MLSHSRSEGAQQSLGLGGKLQILARGNHETSSRTLWRGDLAFAGPVRCVMHRHAEAAEDIGERPASEVVGFADAAGEHDRVESSRGRDARARASDDAMLPD